ncbi:MAG: YihY/virulence factor BrkB family protein [Clostridia bacterium]|nr:YihY/virulence factor BrkB family protein [Clostridia bacterium]
MIKRYFKEIIMRLKEHHIESFSSQIAFYMLLSIFPFLILLFMFLTKLSIDSVEGMTDIYKMLPNQVSQIIQDYLSYSKQFSNKVFSPLLIVAIWMSSNAVIALMKAVNIAYNLEETRNYFIRKGISILCTLLIIVVILIAIIIPNIGVFAMGYVRKYIHMPEMNLFIFNIIRLVISTAVLFLVLAFLYRTLPNKKLKYKAVLPGTVFSFLGLMATSVLFSTFVQNYAQYSIVYGSLAAVIVLMIWLFLCGMILMLGSEINAIKDMIAHESDGVHPVK